MPQDYLVNVGPFKLPRRDLNLPPLPQPGPSKIGELLKGLLMGPEIGTEAPPDWQNMSLAERLNSPSGFRDVGGVIGVMAPWMIGNKLARTLGTMKTVQDMRMLGVHPEVVSFLKNKYPRLLSQIKSIQAVSPDEPGLVAELDPGRVYEFIAKVESGKKALPVRSIGRELRILISKPYIEPIRENPSRAAEVLGEELAHAAQLMMPSGRRAWLYGRSEDYYNRPLERAAKETAKRFMAKLSGKTSKELGPPSYRLDENTLNALRAKLLPRSVTRIENVLQALQSAIRGGVK